MSHTIFVAKMTHSFYGENFYQHPFKFLLYSFFSVSGFLEARVYFKICVFCSKYSSESAPCSAPLRNFKPPTSMFCNYGVTRQPSLFLLLR